MRSFTILLLASSLALGAAAGALVGCSGDDDDSSAPGADASTDGSRSVADSSIPADAGDAGADGSADGGDGGCPDGGRFADGGVAPGCAIDLGSLVTSSTTRLEITTRELFAADGGLLDAGADGGACTRAYEDYVFDISGQTVSRSSCVAVDGGYALETGTVSLTSTQSASLLSDCTKIHDVAPPAGEDAVCDGDPTTLPADFIRTDATGTTVIDGCPSPASSVYTDDVPAFTDLRALFPADGGT